MCHIYQRKIHANAQYVCNRLWVFFAPNISFMYVNDSLLVHIFSDWVPLLHIVENGRKLFFVAFHLSFQKHEVLLWWQCMNIYCSIEQVSKYRSNNICMHIVYPKHAPIQNMLSSSDEPHTGFGAKSGRCSEWKDSTLAQLGHCNGQLLWRRAWEYVSWHPFWACAKPEVHLQKASSGMCVILLFHKKHGSNHFSVLRSLFSFWSWNIDYDQLRAIIQHSAMKAEISNVDIRFFFLLIQYLQHASLLCSAWSTCLSWMVSMLTLTKITVSVREIHGTNVDAGELSRRTSTDGRADPLDSVQTHQVRSKAAALESDGGRAYRNIEEGSGWWVDCWYGNGVARALGQELWHDGQSHRYASSILHPHTDGIYILIACEHCHIQWYWACAYLYPNIA